MRSWICIGALACLAACASGAPSLDGDPLDSSEPDAGSANVGSKLNGSTTMPGTPGGGQGGQGGSGSSPGSSGGDGDAAGDNAGSGGSAGADPAASSSGDGDTGGVGDGDGDGDTGAGDGDGDGDGDAVDQCTDGMKNGFETGTDCGGPDCTKLCSDGQGCIESADCESQVCSAGFVCAAPACDDGVLNGSETDIDCGGSGCDPCATGGTCAADGDCAQGPCLGDKTCGCTALTVAACDANFCGSLDDGCGGSVACPDQCQAPATCQQDMCCEPMDASTCGATQCGTKTDGCGGTVACPFTCEAHQTCNNGACQCDQSQCGGCSIGSTKCCKSDGSCGCALLGFLGCN